MPNQAKSKQPLWVISFKQTQKPYSAQSTSTGGPFLYATLRAITSQQEYSDLLALFDSYMESELTPLERAQFEIQRQWLLSPDSTVPDAEIKFANMPGAAGLPLPDGQMTLWLPVGHLVLLA